MIVAPLTVIGAASSASRTSTVQPSIGLTDTDVKGVSDGRVTVSLVVLAVWDSLGTRNVSWEKPPSDVESGVTPTCADAAPAPKVIKQVATARTAAVLGVRPVEEFIVIAFLRAVSRAPNRTPRRWVLRKLRPHSDLMTARFFGTRAFRVGQRKALGSAALSRSQVRCRRSTPRPRGLSRKSFL